MFQNVSIVYEKRGSKNYYSYMLYIYNYINMYIEYYEKYCFSICIGKQRKRTGNVTFLKIMQLIISFHLFVTLYDLRS